jgi:hypothetical protein
MNNDYIKKLNDIEIYYKNKNIGIGIENPNYKLDVDGSANLDAIYIKDVSIIKGKDEELIIQNKSADNQFSLNKDKSYLITDKLGINNRDPQYTLDVYGDIKLSGELVGNNNNVLLRNGVDITLNPDNKFNKFIVNSPTMFKSNNSSGGVVIGESDVDPQSGTLIVENDIKDIHKNKFVELKNTQQFNINPSSTKKVNIYGKTNFPDTKHGVSIGSIEGNSNSGQLYVQKDITVGQKIKIKDFPNKILDMSGDNKSNIILGRDTYIGNLNSFGDRKQATLIGNNLWADNNNVRVANTTPDGYRGIVMDKYSGINFYTKNTNVITGDIPNLPSMSISNSGQLIYSIPVLEVNNFDSTNLDNPVHKYIRKELGSHKIGSVMDFTTNNMLADNKIFNSIKITESTVRTYIIKKTDNTTDTYFDTNL